MKHFSIIIFIAMNALPISALAMGGCDLNGKPINPDNDAQMAGRTGLLRCRDENTGHLVRERELRNGEYLGKERFFDNKGRLVRERVRNEQGNSHGRVADFWPNGQLKREQFVDNGREQGLTRYFSEQGTPRSMGFYSDGRKLFSVEYNDKGQPTDLQCHSNSLLPQDRKFCGFDGASDTLLYNNKGEKVAQVRYDHSRLVQSTQWEAGVMSAEQLWNGKHRIHRIYSNENGKAVLREERVFEPDDRLLAERRGVLASERRWGASGQLTEQHTHANGMETLLERWYLNGAIRERTTLSGSGREARLNRELYDDEGHITRKQQLTVEQRPTGLQQQFHGNGRLAQEETYSLPEPGGRTRLQARKQWDEAGLLIADDVILEDGSRVRK